MKFSKLVKLSIFVIMVILQWQIRSKHKACFAMDFVLPGKDRIEGQSKESSYNERLLTDFKTWMSFDLLAGKSVPDRAKVFQIKPDWHIYMSNWIPS